MHFFYSVSLPLRGNFSSTGKYENVSFLLLQKNEEVNKTRETRKRISLLKFILISKDLRGRAASQSRSWRLTGQESVTSKNQKLNSEQNLGETEAAPGHSATSFTVTLYRHKRFLKVEIQEFLSKSHQTWHCYAFFLTIFILLRAFHGLLFPKKMWKQYLRIWRGNSPLIKTSPKTKLSKKSVCWGTILQT